MRLAVKLLVLLLLAASSTVAHADEPWKTYECIGEPASTGEATNALPAEWQYSGQVGDDIVVCRLVPASS